jgi:hypothetical protein
MKTIKFVLGEDEYQIALNYKITRDWRKQLKEPIEETLAEIGQVQGVEFSNIEEMIPIVRQLLPTLIFLPDRMAELLLVAHPTLTDNRDKIEEEADDEQIIDAFVKVAKAAFPFDSMMALFPKDSSGRGQKQT